MPDFLGFSSPESTVNAGTSVVTYWLLVTNCFHVCQDISDKSAGIGAGQSADVDVRIAGRNIRSDGYGTPQTPPR